MEALNQHVGHFFQKHTLKPPAKKDKKLLIPPAIPAKVHMIHCTCLAGSEKIDPALECVCVQLVHTPIRYRCI
jgi:hypothetical protein